VCSIDGTTLGNFFLSKNEGLATLDWGHSSSLAGTTFKFESDLLSVLCLLSEDGLGLTSETSLLGIISSLSLSDKGGFSCLVL
jgi:hypothetical protein